MGLRTLRRETGSKAGNAKPRAEAARHRRGQLSSPASTSAHLDPEQEGDTSRSTKVRTGIVSVNGQDVGIMHCRRP